MPDRVGGARAAGGPVRLGGRPAGDPVRTGWDDVTVRPPAGTAYEHRQDEPAQVWIVDHNLGRHPVAWSLYDDADRQRDEFLVEHPTVNRVLVRMDTPTAGTIRLI